MYYQIVLLALTKALESSNIKYISATLRWILLREREEGKKRKLSSKNKKSRLGRYHQLLLKWATDIPRMMEGMDTDLARGADGADANSMVAYIPPSVVGLVCC